MKTLKEVRKSKGLTMGKLAELSGVSAKTVSVYEQDPPKRPSRKVLGKISDALGMDIEDLTAVIYPAKRRAGSRSEEVMEDSLMLDDYHVNRIIRLIDKELEELRYTILDGCEVTEDYPALSRYLDMVGEDIDLLTEIKSRFLS